MLAKEEIQKNFELVKNNIDTACKKVNRDNDVEIIAVTKTFPKDLIQTCIDLGIHTVGENRPLEIRDKYEVFEDKVNWHMIGHVQRNKVKYIIDKVSLIHSLDSIRLAKELDKRAKKNDLVISCLVQINVVDEDSKFGIMPNKLNKFMKELEQFKNIRIVGLMNMAPFYSEPEDSRSDFKKMKNLFDGLKDNNYINVEMKYLSMGMTNDYIVAVEEGSNMVRVGSGIFGKRTYK